MNTRERFIDVAADLFSKYGYNGVSVRDISGKLGMRESAMYKHFSGKSEILDCIIDKASERLNRFAEDIDTSLPSLKAVITELYLKLFELYTEDDFMNKFRKIMIISQYENDSSKRRYQNMFIDKTLNYYAGVFDSALNQNNISGYDAELMSCELYSVLYIIMQKYDTKGAEENRHAKSILIKHIDGFFDKYSFLETLQ